MSSQLEQVLSRFLQTKDFHIHDRISVHLESALLEYIRNNFTSLQPKEKALFVMSVIPRKRITEQIKPQALEMLQLVVEEPGYLGIVAKLAQSSCRNGTMDLGILESTSIFKEFKDRLSTLRPQVMPIEITYLSKKSQTEQILLQDESLITLRKVRANTKERYERYGIGRVTDTPRSTTKATFEPTPPIRQIHHQPASIFIPAPHPTPLNILRPKTSVASAGMKYKKEQKMKLLDLDDAQLLATMQMSKEKTVKPVKEKSKEPKEKPEKVSKPKPQKRKSVDDDGSSPVKRRRSRSASKKRVEKDSSDEDEQVLSDVGDDSGEDNQPDEFGIGPPPEEPPLAPAPVAGINDLLSPEVIPPRFEPVNIDQVLAGADCLGQEQIEEIRNFLMGDYAVQPLKKEFKLSEKIVPLEDNTRKREAMYIILDYSNCKWKKVKRTSRIV